MMELGTDVMDSENKNLEAPAHHTHPPLPLKLHQKVTLTSNVWCVIQRFGFSF